MKVSKPVGLNVRELKALALDDLVKQEITSKHTKQMSKIERLKALRLAQAQPTPRTSQ
jgi:hypothetical protein